MATPQKDNFKGYTLKELRFQRALNQVKLEIGKERLLSRTNNFIKGNKNEGKLAWGFEMAKRLVNGLSYLDLILLAFQGGKQLRKIFGFFGRKKKLKA